MRRLITGLLFSAVVCSLSFADNTGASGTHPCTGETLPLTTEKSVVLAIECLYQGKVAKVDLVQEGNRSYYRLRILTSGGRIKTINVNPETGLPLDARELEKVR